MSQNLFPELAALLFHSREFAHRAHLSTTSHSAHLALGEFYEDLTELTDDLVETYQGRYGIIQIPFCDPGTDTDPVTVLRSHLAIIESVRLGAVPVSDSPIQNKIDEICGRYLRTIYKLVNHR